MNGNAKIDREIRLLKSYFKFQSCSYFFGPLCRKTFFYKEVFLWTASRVRGFKHHSRSIPEKWSKSNSGAKQSRMCTTFRISFARVTSPLSRLKLISRELRHKLLPSWIKSDMYKYVSPTLYDCQHLLVDTCSMYELETMRQRTRTNSKECQ